MRKNPELNTADLTLAVKIFESHIDAKIRKIEILTSPIYLINNEWQIDSSDQTIDRVFPDTD
jgi:hypothetical protein